MSSAEPQLTACFAHLDIFNPLLIDYHSLKYITDANSLVRFSLLTAKLLCEVSELPSLVKSFMSVNIRHSTRVCFWLSFECSNTQWSRLHKSCGYYPAELVESATVT